MNKLRTKSTTYKKKRQELAELRAELGVLARTEEILKTKDNMINQTMVSTFTVIPTFTHHYGYVDHVLLNAAL